MIHNYNQQSLNNSIKFIDNELIRRNGAAVSQGNGSQKMIVILQVAPY